MDRLERRSMEEVKRRLGAVKWEVSLMSEEDQRMYLDFADYLSNQLRGEESPSEVNHLKRRWVRKYIHNQVWKKHPDKTTLKVTDTTQEEAYKFIRQLHREFGRYEECLATIERFVFPPNFYEAMKGDMRN